MSTRFKGNRDAAYELVTDAIKAALERGDVAWHQGWAGGSSLPLRMSGGFAHPKPYRGSNVFLLWLTALAEGYESPWWGTYDQIQTLGGQVRGPVTNPDGTVTRQRGTLVTFWKRNTYPDPDNLDENGRPGTKIVPMLRYHKVFNASQAIWPEGSKAAARFFPAKGTAPEGITDAELIMKDYLERDGAPSLAWDGGGGAHYSPVTDVIHLPARESFEDAAYLYGTAFHEMTHSTGHESRLNRPGIAQFDHFGSERYSKEELVAEMAAAMLAAMSVGAAAHTDNSAAYVAGWLSKIGDDPKMVVQAGAQAQHAVDCITGTTYENGDES